jgi:hypothetical protein
MFHKFKITTCAFILCLFGLTLMTVSPVFAADEDSPAFKQCQQIKPHGKFGPMKQKKNCFRDLARMTLNAGKQVIARQQQQLSRSRQGTAEECSELEHKAAAARRSLAKGGRAQGSVRRLVDHLYSLISIECTSPTRKTGRR